MRFVQIHVLIVTVSVCNPYTMQLCPMIETVPKTLVLFEDNTSH